MSWGDLLGRATMKETPLNEEQNDDVARTERRCCVWLLEREVVRFMDALMTMEALTKL